MKHFILPLIALSTLFLSSCKNNQDSEINISCKLSYLNGKEEDVYFVKFSIDTEDNLTIIETTYPAVFSTALNKQLEEETKKRLGNLIDNSKKYIVQYEYKEGGYQYRDTYSFDKNDVSKVKTIFEVKEDSNYVIDKFATSLMLILEYL